MNKLKNITYYNGLLDTYLKLSWLVIPLLSIEIIASYFQLLDISNFQFILILIGLGGLIMINIFKKKNWFKSNFYVLQVIFLLILITIELFWYYHNPGSRQLISLILGITITGIGIINPLKSIIFYGLVVLLISGINYLKLDNFFLNIPYVFISAICIIFFNFWREKLIHQLHLAKTSYKNIFSESEYFIFVIDESNFRIIEQNQQVEIEYPNIKLEKTSIFSVFQTEKNEIVKRIEQLNLKSESLTFSTNFDLNNTTYIPKQFHIKKTIYDNKSVILLTVKYITKLKNQENKLQENKSFLDNIFESSLDMIITTDQSNIITSINKAAITRFGYKKNELLGTNLDILLDQKARINSNILSTIIKDEKYIGEVKNIDKNGSTFNSYLSATTIRNEKSELIGYMGISRDLSEINEIKNIITSQTSLIESLFKNDTNTFIWIYDKDLNIVSFNKSTKDFFNNKIGIDLKINENFLEQIKPNIQENHIDITTTIYYDTLKGKKYQFEALMINKKGNKEWVEVHLNPIILPNGKIKEVVCLGHNITDKKEKKKQLEKNEKNTKAILNAIPDLMLTISKTGIILDYKAHSDHQKSLILNFLPNGKKLIGSQLNDIFKTELKFSKDVTDFVNKSIIEDKIFHHNFSHKFGNKTLHFENRYCRINDNEAIIVVRETTLEIEKENELKESLKEKEVHHRVKNNLQIINSILNLQSSYISDDKTLEIIKESQNRIRSMSYIHESLYQTSNFSTISFKEYIDNLINNLFYSYQVGNKITINKTIDNIDLPLDQAIPSGLILNELISNALKHAYKKDEEGKINVIIKKTHSKIEIIVEDFGCGLPDNFDISNSDSLGLSLVETLIDQLDGKLIIKTTDGTKILIIFEILEN